MHTLEVHSETAEQPDAARLHKLLTDTLESEQAELGAVSISFVEPETIRDINKRYRSKDRPTDVLSFAADDTFPGAMAQLFVCPAIVRTEATTAESLLQKLDELIVHGLLHALGHEDETEAGKRRMAERTALILTGPHG